MALEANVKQYTDEMEKARRQTDGLGKDVADLDRKLGQIREGAGIGIAVGTAAGLGVATKAASDLREAQAAANVVFGESSDIITRYAEDAAQAIGLSKKEALDATGTFGNFFAQMGVGQEEAARLSMQLTTLGADFASRFNESDATRVIEAQTAAFRGEYDALQRYVPTINAAAVEQRALADTGKANADSLTQQEKALAVYALMMDGAGAAVGDFARSNGSAATEAKKAAAESKNAAASMGEALLPVAAKLAETIGFLAHQFGRLPGPMQTGVVGLGGLTAATLLLLPKLAETWALVSRGVSKLGDLGAAGDGASGSTGRLGKALGAAGLIGVLVGATFALNEYRKATSGLKVDTEALLGATNDQIAAELLRVSKAGVLKEGDLVKVGQQDINVLYAMRDALKANGQDALPELESAIVRVQDEMARAAVRSEKYAEQENAEMARSQERARKYLESADAASVFADALGQLASEAGGNFLQDAIDGMTDWSEATVRGGRIARAFAEAIQSTIDVKAATDELADSRGRLADTERGLRDAYESVAAANRSVAAARESVADAERSLRDAYAGVEEARRGVTDAEEAAVTARQNIVIATEELAAAERAATGDSDEYRAAMQGVYDAEADLTTAQENSLTAQQALDQARQDYTRTLAGLQRGAEGAADGVIAAEIRLRDAQEALATLGDSQRRRVEDASTRLANLEATASAEQRASAERALADAIAALPDADDRLRAELAVRDAMRGVTDAQERATDAAAEAARVAAAGVEGSDAVVAARQGVIDATGAEVDAQGNLEAAVMRVAGVQVDANGRVTVAQDALQAAIRDRVDADQAVIDARDAVVDAQLRVGDAVRGVRDANQGVVDALRGVRDANERVTEQKEAVVTARGEVTKAEQDLATAISNSIGKYNELYLVTSYESQVRVAMRNMTSEVRDLVAALGGLNGDFTANVNLGGNAASAILNGTTSGFESVMSTVMGSPYAAPIVLVPPDKSSAGPKMGGRSSMAPVPQMAPNWAQPSSLSNGIDYAALGAAVAASLPYQGPLVKVENVNEGVGLDAVFRQAEFAARAA